MRSSHKRKPQGGNLGLSARQLLRSLRLFAGFGNDRPLACLFTTSLAWKLNFECWCTCLQRQTCPNVVGETRPANSPLAVALEECTSLAFKLAAEDGRSALFQTDWDWPSLASNFEWVPCKQCTGTDGTVDCAHSKASDMMADAYDYLREHCGETIPDPGYFS